MNIYDNKAEKRSSKRYINPTSHKTIRGDSVVKIEDNRPEAITQREVISGFSQPIQLVKKRKGPPAASAAAESDSTDSEEVAQDGAGTPAASDGTQYQDLPHLDLLIKAGTESGTELPALETLAEMRITSALKTLDPKDKELLRIEYHFEGDITDEEFAAKLVEAGVTNPDDVFNEVSEFQFRPGFQDGEGGSGWQNAATRRLKRQTDQDTRSAPGTTALHHKIARDQIRRWRPELKFLANHPANYTHGPLPEHRSDDPKTGFDPNFSGDGTGAMTPRSSYLSRLTGAEDPAEVRDDLDALHEKARGSIRTQWDMDRGKHRKRH